MGAGLSFGVAEADGAMDLAGALARADAALYLAKEPGRGVRRSRRLTDLGHRPAAPATKMAAAR